MYIAKTNKSLNPQPLSFVLEIPFMEIFVHLNIGIIYLGLIWQKNESAITQKVRSFLPLPLRESLAERTT